MTIHLRQGIPLSVIMSPGIPEGYYELTDPTALTKPGDIYINSRGTWSESMRADEPVGKWTTYARKKRKAARLKAARLRE